MAEGSSRGTGLTANAVKNAGPKEKPYKLSDRDGLYLLVKPTGVRYGRMNYRLNGQQRALSFGRWPEIMLSEAREMLLEAQRKLAKRVDPAEQAKLGKIAKSLAATNTFETIAEEWLDKIEKEGSARLTLKKARWLLDKTYAAIGRRPITEISAHELLLVLKKEQATKRYNAANRIRSTGSQVFRYAIATARAQRVIAVDLRGALATPREQRRAAVTTAAEATALLRAVEDYEVSSFARIALRLLPHLFVRPGELRWAEWKEFDFTKGVWRIKSGQPWPSRSRSINRLGCLARYITVSEHDHRDRKDIGRSVVELKTRVATSSRKPMQGPCALANWNSMNPAAAI